MNNPLIDAARMLAKAHEHDRILTGAADAARLILAELGAEDDPAPANAHHPSGRSGRDVVSDTDRKARTDYERESKTKADLAYHPGRGFSFTKHTAREWSSEVTGNKYYTSDERGHIPEGVVLAMADEVRARQGMARAAEEFRRYAKKTENRHPGYDTVDAGQEGMPGEKCSDDFRIDTSRSTCHLAMVSGRAWLNGSQVEHSRYIRMEFHGPDGRELLEVGMSLDQFASFLTSQGFSPCTMQSYWSINDANIRLAERVRPVESVRQRMEVRVRSRLDEYFGRMVEVADKIKASADAGKPISKTAAAELAKDLALWIEHAKGVPDFAVQQASEEVAGVVEQAAAHMSKAFGVDLPTLALHPMVASMALDRPRIAAPKPDVSSGTAEGAGE